MPVGLVVADLSFHLSTAGVCLGCQRPAIGLSPMRPVCSGCSQHQEDNEISRALIEWERKAA